MRNRILTDLYMHCLVAEGRSMCSKCILKEKVSQELNLGWGGALPGRRPTPDFVYSSRHCSADTEGWSCMHSHEKFPEGLHAHEK
jgi:hypothetical protein